MKKFKDRIEILNEKKHIDNLKINSKKRIKDMVDNEKLIKIENRKKLNKAKKNINNIEFEKSKTKNFISFPNENRENLLKILSTKRIYRQNELYSINLKNNKNVISKSKYIDILNDNIVSNNNKNKILTYKGQRVSEISNKIIIRKDLRNKELYNNDLKIEIIRLDKKNESNQLKKSIIDDNSNTYKQESDFKYDKKKREKIINLIQSEIEKKINSKKDKWIKSRFEGLKNEKIIKYLDRDNILNSLNSEVNKQINNKLKLKNDLSIKRNLLEDKYNIRREELNVIKKQREIKKKII